LVVTPGPSVFDRDALNKGILRADSDFVSNIGLPGAKTDAQVCCTFSALIPGATYRIIFQEPAGPIVHKDFTVEPGKTVDLGDLSIRMD
jgi:hypothetical protein